MTNQADLSVRTMCRVLGVSASGFYAWRDRAPSQRSIANAVMTERIRQIHQDSYESYGMPRVRAELIEQGVCISRQRVAHLMRQAGIHGISKRRGFTVTTRRDKRQTPAHDLVKRRFHATAPNQLWVADMTYVSTWMGFLYLAVVIDVWSRRVVGWAMGERMTADLVLTALNMALEQRKPKGVIHHSDQGRPVHERGLRGALPADAGQAFDENGGRCLRQRDGRELLCQPRRRTHRAQHLPEQGSSPNGRLHLD